MKNLKIKTKLTVSFLILALLMVVIAVVSLTQITRMSGETTGNQQYIAKPLEYMARFGIAYGQVRSATRDLGRSTTEEDNNKHKTTLETNMALCVQYITDYRGLALANPHAAPEEVDAIEAMHDAIQAYADLVHNGLIPAGMNNENDRVFTYITVELAPSGAILRENLDFLSTYLTDRGDQSLVMAETDLRNGMIINLSILGVALIVAVFLVRYISALIATPIKDMMGYIKQAGETGNLKYRDDEWAHCDELSQGQDEIGQTMKAFTQMMRKFVYYGETVNRVADHDLTVQVETLGPDDTFGVAIEQMVDNLGDTFANIHSSTDQVATGAKQIADGAQSLAQGATEQASVVQELSASVAEIARKTKDNANLAVKAANLAGTIQGSAQKGSAQMAEMTQAVREINEASQNIRKVMSVIEQIAFQTNILALNASVEAARAGQHGRGFAVVAEEVRSLAAKSDEAAKETGGLIQNSMEKAELGARIADETAESLAEIVAGIGESATIVSEIAVSSEEQAAGISQINVGIDQVAQVVQQNSATAEESAAASQEMSSQSSLLEELVSQFKIKDVQPALSVKASRRAMPAPDGSYAAVSGESYGKY